GGSPAISQRSTVASALPGATARARVGPGHRSPGATGFWVWVDGPRDVSGVPEFYTSDYVTRFG
ncbi:hypothetical protein LOC73_04425, partial [Mycolicibacterium mageritense]|nr:hypothetical protein [Mycolicibacterium mageritense]